MDEKLIHSLWDRFDRSDVSELIYETSEGKFSLKKAEPQKEIVIAGGMPVQNAMPASMPQAGLSVNATAAGAAAGNAAKAAVAADDGIYVRSPLPGTFYRAASPDDEPFVMIGKKIKQGDVIGIVESMKMMNEIVAGEDGTVAEIYAEDGTMVGYDEKLIRLEK
ncbi:MAG: acetyl-CoA carboxylase biotin carboxyl carrier protein [Eubacteriales bacterium]|nr:acetyl-CoA carboxylase biotin carboxyl carrier protein [Eubacteriales bacterium]